MALWQNQGQYPALDETATPIQDDSFTSDELILVVGSDAPEHTLDLLRALEKVPTVAEHIQSATRIEGRRWNLYTTGKIKILLPQTHIEKALMRLDLQNMKQDLFKKDISSIDMRVDGKIKMTRVSQKITTKKKGQK